MNKQSLNTVEITRIIMAKDMGIPPDDIDMLSIFICVQRSIDEKVENDLDEYILIPANKKEMDAIVSPIGEKIIPMIFNYEYPFGDCIKKYEEHYTKNLEEELLRIKSKFLPHNKEQ